MPEGFCNFEQPACKDEHARCHFGCGRNAGRSQTKMRGPAKSPEFQGRCGFNEKIQWFERLLEGSVVQHLHLSFVAATGVIGCGSRTSRNQEAFMKLTPVWGE
jgi:hypothetical protein